jgi:hypothetical protein
MTKAGRAFRGLATAVALGTFAAASVSPSAYSFYWCLAMKTASVSPCCCPLAEHQEDKPSATLQAPRCCTKQYAARERLVPELRSPLAGLDVPIIAVAPAPWVAEPSRRLDAEHTSTPASDQGPPKYLSLSTLLI